MLMKLCHLTLSAWLTVHSFDATLTEVTDLKDGGQLVKTAAWYDNEMSFTAQLIRTLEYFAKIAK